MTPEQIFEIANGFLNIDGLYRFHKENLVAFAQAIIAAERKGSDEPDYWLLPPGIIVEYDPETYGIEGDAIAVLYKRPLPARKMTDGALKLFDSIERRINGEEE